VGVCSNFSTGVAPSLVIPVGHGDFGAETVVVAARVVGSLVVGIVVGEIGVVGTGTVVDPTVVVSSTAVKQPTTDSTAASVGVLEDGVNLTTRRSASTGSASTISLD
jgi:hypothetical protein